jgi:hypothetical protein
LSSYRSDDIAAERRMLSISWTGAPCRTVPMHVEAAARVGASERGLPTGPPQPTPSIVPCISLGAFGRALDVWRAQKTLNCFRGGDVCYWCHDRRRFVRDVLASPFTEFGERCD